MSTIVVACPECQKALTVPAELAGKKIRCKGCGATFPIRAMAAAKPASAKPAKPPPAPAKPSDDEDDGPAQFGFVKEDAKTVARCPHCATELDSEDAVLCLHCGYNLRTRQKLETKKVVQTTGGDYFSWLLPGILAVAFIIGLVLFDLWWVFKLEDAVKGGDYEWLGYKGFRLWIVIFSLFAMFFAGKFAVSRLIFNPHPPEKDN